MKPAPSDGAAVVPDWIPLLRRLTERLPGWGLWKNSEAALEGHGDFDSTAPVEDWPTILTEFRTWAAGQGYGPVAACREVPGVLFLVALDPVNHRVVELDVNARKYFRGWTMFRAEDLPPLMELDARGFRRVRPGAEGLILLTQNGLRRGGRPDFEGLRRKRVARFVQSDPAGVRAAARVFFGPARKAAERSAGRVAQGGWSRGASLAMEAYAAASALASPRILLERMLVPGRKGRCPLLRTIFEHDRRVDDPQRWIREVAVGHELYEND